MGLFGGDIELCPSGGDIELCLERDIELCLECTELTLTGDDEPEVGTTYEATGGAGDLTFSFDKGTITITSTTPATDTEPRKVVATITAIDSCGASGEDRTATVSVEDSCTPTPQTAEIVVRLPGGKWVWTHTDYLISGHTQYPGETWDWFADESPAWESACCIATEDSVATMRVYYDDNSSEYARFLTADGQCIQIYTWDTRAAYTCYSAYCDCPFCADCSGHVDDWDALSACMKSRTADLPTSDGSDLLLDPDKEFKSLWPSPADDNGIAAIAYLEWKCL